MEIMKKYLLGAVLFLGVTSGVIAQETKKISGIHTSLNGQSPHKFVLEDETVRITFAKGSSMRADLEVFNKSDKSIDFLWNDSYFVLNGESFPARNGGISPVKMHTLHNEVVDVNKPVKIGPNSSYRANMASEEKYIFNQNDAYHYYNTHAKQLVNRIVPVLMIDSKKQEYPISVELYTKKNLKDLQSK